MLDGPLSSRAAGLDLLLTHEPPLGILDVSVSGKKLGDKHLKEKVFLAEFDPSIYTKITQLL